MKIDTKVVHLVYYTDLDDAIRDFLMEKGAVNSDFEVACIEELNNDSAKMFNVAKISYAISDTEKNMILGGDLGFQTETILDWMCCEDKIPAGKYIVDVSW